jgi:hypothetical protein
MSFQAYLDKVKAKTGKTPEDFARLASRKGLARHGDIVKWLKSDFSLGHGHATAIAAVVTRKDVPKASADEKISALFGASKQHWRRPCESAIAKIKEFGSDAGAGVGGTYINLLRAGRKFAILQPSSSDRLDIGIKLKGASADERFEAAGSWNTALTHRVRIHEPGQIDRAVFSWLRRAYDAGK